MDSLLIKLPKTLSARVSRLAKQRSVSRTEVVRDALEAYLAAGGLSAGSAVGDLKGCLKGLPRDLSTNHKYLERYGE